MKEMSEQAIKQSNSKYIFFYGHRKSEEGISETCFSQFYGCEFKVDGRHYCCAEQFMMASKARTFRDATRERGIMASQKPATIKAMGRMVKPFDAELWETVSYNVVARGNYYKFTQNEALKDFLLATGEKILVEASPTDTIWGVGLSAKSKDIKDEKNWRGRNLLGKALMEVRSAIRRNVPETKFMMEHPIMNKRILDWEKRRAKLPAAREKTGARKVDVTRMSTIMGLLESPKNRKWELFLMEGPYWTYLANYIRRRKLFRGREDLVAESVTEACTKIGKFLCTKKYAYPEEGKGFFRGFIKSIAFRAALDVLKRTKRYERLPEDEIPESEKECREMAEAEKSMLATNGQDLDERIRSRHVSERDLDVYDLGFKLERALSSVKTMSPAPIADEPNPRTYDPSSFYEYLTNVSRKDQTWLQKLQLHVLHIALGHLLCNQKEPAARREMLRLRFGCDKRPKDILKRPDFCHLTQDAFDQKMRNAIEDLKREVNSWWRLVAPEKHDFADENVMKLWRGLLASPRRYKIGKALKRKAENMVGGFE